MTKQNNLAPMDAVYRARRKNLQTLIGQHDGQQPLAAALGYTTNSFVSQLATGRRRISEKVAREIESKLKLACNWLDGGAS